MKEVDRSGLHRSAHYICFFCTKKQRRTVICVSTSCNKQIFNLLQYIATVHIQRARHCVYVAPPLYAQKRIIKLDLFWVDLIILIKFSSPKQASTGLWDRAVIVPEMTDLSSRSYTRLIRSAVWRSICDPSRVTDLQLSAPIARISAVTPLHVVQSRIIFYDNIYQNSTNTWSKRMQCHSWVQSQVLWIQRIHSMATTVMFVCNNCLTFLVLALLLNYLKPDTNVNHCSNT